MENSKISYTTQYNKLTEAYIRNEVNPFMDCNCFVGNLLNNHGSWSGIRNFGRTNNSIDFCPILKNYNDFGYNYGRDTIISNSEGMYTPEDIVSLEKRFLQKFNANCNCVFFDKNHTTLEEEEALFIAFESTLDLLKEIHISKGEVIDDSPKFVKRELVLC